MASGAAFTLSVVRARAGACIRARARHECMHRHGARIRLSGRPAGTRDGARGGLAGVRAGEHAGEHATRVRACARLRTRPCA
eukprot:6186467-Pleurochrysis_carterae.AAC.1